ncbi:MULTISPECIES: ABC transporter substrate-binding protein [Pseudonocardia]|uniref:Corrinoid ABC transporter substrate-binding protein n=2 Tax=Pseudonocardia TaxID=1847 RepID=A0A1Y2N9A6_PSEAH|nr:MULTISPECIES: ABC transporter substrate-binding protein [Pseudonocardia]OSY44050.1 corrinoid ABC transporter substrate-binding protein [Pseudonocardia autotrophica]TDN74220.1 iron complex transport system substrate-binding protein [Pseudonocardia autotrophica]BBG04980.1 ABC transporter substrate-binding protein [Pseudonocardia autotrophica]GEC23636.1 ABC transporter substrate-binding protein [Pseudonocardia saturnea]
MSVRSVPRRIIPVAVTAVAVLALAACGGPPAPEAGGAAGEPVTEVNCGIEVTVPAPPERIYAFYQPAIETLHALGVSDRLVGTAYLDAPVLDEFARAQEDVAYLPDLPTREVLLAAEPDFVLSGYNNSFAASGAETVSTRADLAELGVRTWINAPLCPTEDGASDEAIDPAQVSMDTIYDDLRSLGRLLGAQERADELVADLQGRVTAVQERVEGKPKPRVAILLNDDDGSYRVASGIDFGSRILEMAGAENAFADLTERRHVAVSKEELIARDPDIILTSTCCDPATVDADGESDVAQIMGDPALSGSTAVRENAVHPFLFANRAASLRAPYAAEQVADLVHPE